MKKILALITVLASTITITGCIESTSAETTPKRTTLVCDFAGNIETHNVISGAVDLDYSYGYISINYTNSRVFYPAHACKVTRFK